MSEFLVLQNGIQENKEKWMGRGESVCEDDRDNTNMDQVICHDDRKQGNGIDFYNSLSILCYPVEDKSLVVYEVETEEGVGVVRITGGWIQVF